MRLSEMVDLQKATLEKENDKLGHLEQQVNAFAFIVLNKHYFY